jgi:hypothetical protein
MGGKDKKATICCGALRPRREVCVRHDECECREPVANPNIVQGQRNVALGAEQLAFAEQTPPLAAGRVACRESSLFSPARA